MPNLNYKYYILFLLLIVTIINFTYFFVLDPSLTGYVVAPQSNQDSSNNLEKTTPGNSNNANENTQTNTNQNANPNTENLENKHLTIVGGSGNSGSTRGGGSSSGDSNSGSGSNSGEGNSDNPPINLSLPEPISGNNSESNITNKSDGGDEKSKNKKIKNINSNFKLKKNGVLVTDGDFFQGKNRFRLEKGNFIIAEFDINFTEDIDLSGLVADSDELNGKSYMHLPGKILKNITLFVPKLQGQNSVVVCSNASSYLEVYEGCGNNPHITSEYILTLDSPDLILSGDGNYFLVTGITGTGAFGANITDLNTSRAQADNAEFDDALAGNLSLLGVSGDSITQSWQGYFGNVSGTIMLADSSDNVMYNWSLASPEGEIYAANTSSINWLNLTCFNYTATGTKAAGEVPGTTSLFGKNLVQLEAEYNINSDDIDGVNETFIFGPNSGASGHDLFYTANLEFSEGECINTRVYNNTGTGGDGNFEEVLLYDTLSGTVLFTSILDEEDVSGFDGNFYDFEMLVLEDGHGTDTATTRYYFWVELE